MRNYGIILFVLSTFILVQCNISTNKSTDEKKEEIEEKASSYISLDILKTDENEDTKEFASVPAGLHLHVDEVSNTEGTVQSMSFDGSRTIDSVKYILSIFLPAGEKLQFNYDYEGKINAITDGLPAHILGEDYKAFDDGMDETPNAPKAILEVSDTKTKEYDFIVFDLKELILYSLEAKDYKLNSEFDFYGASERNYSCVIKLHVFEEDVIMTILN